MPLHAPPDGDDEEDKDWVVPALFDTGMELGRKVRQAAWMTDSLKVFEVQIPSLNGAMRRRRHRPVGDSGAARRQSKRQAPPRASLTGCSRPTRARRRRRVAGLPKRRLV
jgi:hypothetical protein